jgi:Cu-processing system permease protein
MSAAMSPGSSTSSTLARLLALAGSGWRQAVRDKLLYVLAGFCVVLIGGSLVISELTVGERARIVLDLGLSATSILANLVAVFVTINQAAREIERKTVVVVLTKPVARWELLAGRFLGMTATLALMIAVMGALHALTLQAVDGLVPGFAQALVLTWAEAVLVAAIALFFSSFATPLPAMFLTLAFIVIGHTSWGLRALAETAGPSLRVALAFLYRTLPNLALLDVRSAVTWGSSVPWSHVGNGLAYAAGYSAVLLALGSFALSRRDLT